MKTSRLLLLLPFAVLFGCASPDCDKCGEHKEGGKTSVGSIRPAGKVKETELPALAKISYNDALKAALAAAPGSPIKGELEVEEGTLMYSFEIVGADHKVTEVEIDAGNGKVLEIEKE